MLTLIALTFMIFFIFWIGDLYLTRKTVKKVGPGVELNPLLKRVLGFRGKFLWIFKILEISLFIYLLYFLAVAGSGTVPFYILLGYILVYGILVANNSSVYYKATGKESKSFRYIFVAATMILVLLTYLNFYIYSGLVHSYDSLQECKSDYNELARSCNSTTDVIDDDDGELDSILNSINIQIPRPR